MDSIGRKLSSSKGSLLLLGFIAMAIANGSRQGYGVFLPVLVTELGSSNASLAGAFSIIHLINGFLAPLVGRSIDRYPPRPIFVTGTFLVTGAFILLGLAENLWHIYAIIGLILAPGISCIGMTAVNTLISRYFATGRGTALGFVAMGSGVGTFCFMFFSSYLITWIGWRETFWVWGGLQFVILLPLVLKVLAIPKEEQEVNSIKLSYKKHSPVPWRNRIFILLFFSVIFFTMANFIYLMYAVAYAQSQGVTYSLATGALSLVGISNTLGSLSLVALSDLFRKRTVALVFAIGLVVVALVMILILPLTYPVLIFGSIIFGLGMGGYYPLLPALVGDFFDQEQIGSIYGIILMAGGIGAFAGPVIGGWIYDLTTFYSVTVGMALIFAVIAIGGALYLSMKNLRREEVNHDHVSKGSH